MLCAACLLLPTRATAWGKAGHEIVGVIAEERLGPAARSMVRELVGDIPISDPKISDWADVVKDSRTRRWHYVDIPFSAEAYDPARDCPRGACAVAATVHFTALLEGYSDPSERAEALRWLVHLVADLHQPLHAGSTWDRGGNSFAVRIGRRKQPTNFHRVWDMEMLKPIIRSRSAVGAARELSARITVKEARDWSSELNPASWAIESSHEARAIHAELERQPTERTILQLPHDYVESEQLRASRALERAGVRLAALLDDIARRRARAAGGK